MAPPPTNIPASLTNVLHAIHALREEVADNTYNMELVHKESADSNHHVRQMEQMILAMCQQNRTDLNHIDIGGLTNHASTSEIPSPLGNFRGLSISCGGPGERTSSTHSSAHSMHSSEFSNILNNLSHT
jgi:hypothetical protein